MRIDIEAFTLRDRPYAFQLPSPLPDERLVSKRHLMETERRSKVTVINGETGIGKTTLALEFIHASKYQKVIWVHA